MIEFFLKKITASFLIRVRIFLMNFLFQLYILKFMWLFTSSWHIIYYPVCCDQKVRKPISLTASVIFFWSLQVRTELIYLLPYFCCSIRTSFQSAVKGLRKDILVIKLFSHQRVLYVIKWNRLSRAVFCE